MAELYMGKITGDQGFEKLVCIKKIHPHLAGDEKLVKSFIDEAKLAAYLNHENIVQIYDFGNMEGAYFITMEYLFGKDLREIIKKAKSMKLPISLENALLIVTRVCAGLDFAHRLKNFQGTPLNIIHRDISPPNIFVTYDGQVKIIDFGIAKAASMDETTQFGLVKGKAAYMSPEQADGKAIDYRSDLFSTGILLYEMITGKRMYEGETLDIISRAKNAEFEPPQNIVKDIHPSLLHILNRVLSKDVDKRYQSGGEMQRELEECIYQLSLRPTAVNMGRYMIMLFREESLGEERVMRSIARGSSPEDIEAGIIDGTQPYLVEGSGINEVDTNYEKTVVLKNGLWTKITGFRLFLISLGLAIFLIIGTVVFLSRDEMTITKLNEGFRALDVNDFNKAEIIFNDVLKKDPSFKGRIYEEYSRALLSRAVQIQENDLKTAERMLIKAVELDPDNSKIYFSLGSLYNETGNHPMAIEMLKKVDSESVEFPEALMSLGRIYEKENNLAIAEETYTQLVELAPPFLDEALIRLARVQEKRGKLDKSIIALKQATMINPENKIAKKLLERIEQKLEDE
jgi:tetratricopeptide (TPR) repeat protein/tRNA A-37 threonylcarbamoyl transferase component Bud32